MVISVILGKIRSFFKYREMVRQLSDLNDAALKDIGISRSDIMRVSRNASA